MFSLCGKGLRDEMENGMLDVVFDRTNDEAETSSGDEGL